MTAGRGALLLGASILVGAVAPWRETLGGYTPDLPLVAVMLLAARAGSPSDAASAHREGPRSSEIQALALAACAGLVEDVLTTSPLGVHALALTVVAYAVCWLRDRIHIEALPVRAALLLVAPVASEGLVGTFLQLVTRLPLEPGGGGALARGVATLVLGLLVWRAPRPSAAARRA